MLRSVTSRKEGNVLFNDALNTFYLWLYGVRHMVKDHSDSEKGNPLLPYRLLFPISSKGSFICTMSECSYHGATEILRYKQNTPPKTNIDQRKSCLPVRNVSLAIHQGHDGVTKSRQTESNIVRVFRLGCASEVNQVQSATTSSN